MIETDWRRRFGLMLAAAEVALRDHSEGEECFCDGCDALVEALQACGHYLPADVFHSEGRAQEGVDRDNGL